jgi:hypothetical protein
MSDPTRAVQPERGRAAGPFARSVSQPDSSATGVSGASGQCKPAAPFAPSAGSSTRNASMLARSKWSLTSKCWRAASEVSSRDGRRPRATGGFPRRVSRPPATRTVQPKGPPPFGDGRGPARAHCPAVRAITSRLSPHPTFFRFRQGAAVLVPGHLSPAFFNLGFFRRDGLAVSPDSRTFTLHPTQRAASEPPLPADFRHANGDDPLTADGRFPGKTDLPHRPRDEKTLTTRIAIRALPLTASTAPPGAFELTLTSGVTLASASLPNAASAPPPRPRRQTRASPPAVCITAVTNPAPSCSESLPGAWPPFKRPTELRTTARKSPALSAQPPTV